MVHVAVGGEDAGGQPRHLEAFGRTHCDHYGCMGLRGLGDPKGVRADDADNLGLLPGEVGRERLADQRADAAGVLDEREASQRKKPSCL